MMQRRSFFKIAGLATVAGFATAACAAPKSIDLVPVAATVTKDAGLRVNDELIADADIFNAAVREGSLNLYTGYVENSEKAVIEAFTRDTGIKVNMIRLVPNRLLERVLSEAGAGKLSADVIRTSDPSNAQRMAAAGAFAEYRVPNAKVLDDSIINESGKYYRVFDPAFTFAYNTAIVEPQDAPDSWESLLDPKWRGKIGITQVGAGGSSLSLTRFQMEKLGEEYLVRLAAQKPRIFDSSGAMQESLSRGEISVATAVISSVNIAIAKNAPVQFVVPKEGFALYDYFVGMTPVSQHPNAAKVFMNWNLSRRGGEVFASIGEYPANPEVAPPIVHGKPLPRLTSGLPFRPQPAALAEHQKSDQAFWNQAFGYIG